jgi:hypothetical protein
MFQKFSGQVGSKKQKHYGVTWIIQAKMCLSQ